MARAVRVLPFRARAWTSVISSRRAAASNSSTCSPRRIGESLADAVARCGTCSRLIDARQAVPADDVRQFARCPARIAPEKFDRFGMNGRAGANSGRTCRKYRRSDRRGDCAAAASDDHDVETVVKVFAELLLADGGFEVAVSARRARPRNRFCRPGVAAFSPGAHAKFAWRAGLMSPISSRKIVPWSLYRSANALRVRAGKRARSWPNNSLSSRVSGIAAQLMALKGALARSLCW